MQKHCAGQHIRGSAGACAPKPAFGPQRANFVGQLCTASGVSRRNFTRANPKLFCNIFSTAGKDIRVLESFNQM